jgi:hypothetical protein
MLVRSRTLGSRPGVRPTPNVAVRDGTRPCGTSGDKAKLSAARQRNRRLCCESANDNSPLPAAVVSCVTSARR